MRRRILMLAIAGLFGAFMIANNAEAGMMKKKHCGSPCETPCATPCETPCYTPCEPKCKKPKKHCFKKKKVCCEVVYAAPCSPCGSPTYPSMQATPQAPSKSM
jgi:hypothetical protein